MVEELSVVAVVFAKHLELAFVACSGFPVECVVDFGMVGARRFVHVVQEGVDGLCGALEAVTYRCQHFAQFLRLVIHNGWRTQLCFA